MQGGVHRKQERTKTPERICIYRNALKVLVFEPFSYTAEFFYTHLLI